MNVLIKEVGPRDGLQSEKIFIPTKDKAKLIESLILAGQRYIEVTSFVSPKAIPQLKDAEELISQIPQKKGIIYSALVPTKRSMERAIAAQMKEIAVFTAASDSFNQANIKCDIKESFNRIKEIIELAEKHRINVRAYVSTAFFCPYEGKIKPSKVVDVASRLLDMGCYEVSIGDTVGRATPKMVKSLFEKLLKRAKPSFWAGHFHDTYGMAIANVMAAFETGIQTFDGSVGGLGGCPYAPGASGNVATEDLVYLFEEMGVNTGLNLDVLTGISKTMYRKLGRNPASKVYQALVASQCQ